MANEDWDEAVRRVEKARAEGAPDLDLRDLRVDSLPPQIEKLTGLNILLLDNTRITDAGLYRLAPLTELRELSLDNTRITDAGLDRLAPLTGLLDLSLGVTEVTDAGLDRLAPLTGLRALWLNETKVTDLRPLLSLLLLTDRPWDQSNRLYIGDTPALKDPAIAAAMAHDDPEEQRLALLAHLRSLPEWPAPLPRSSAPAGTIDTASSHVPAILTDETQIAFLLDHAAASQVSAQTTANQIRFALRDVPATDGNRLPVVLQAMENVASILDRVADSFDTPDPNADLVRRIAELEAAVADLTRELSETEKAKEAAEALAKANGFWGAYRKSAGLAAGAGTIALAGICSTTSLVYFLGAEHPAVQSLLTVLGRLPK